MLSRMTKKSPLAELWPNKKITKIFWISKMWRKKTSQVTALNVELMHMILVMKMKCLHCHQLYLNVSTPPPLLLKKSEPSPSPEQSKLDFSRNLHPTPVDNNNFSFGLNWNNFSQPQLSKPLETCSPGIFLSMDAK